MLLHITGRQSLSVQQAGSAASCAHSVPRWKTRAGSTIANTGVAFTMLVTSRINRMSLTLGMGYNYASGVTDGYLLFPYPFFVAVPGYTVTHGTLRSGA